LPDYASVNLDECAAIQVIEALLDRGIGIEAGLSTRVGLEDTKFLPDGSAAASNAELVATAFERLRRATT
jgi:uncharacterized protein (DUF849 family)